MAIIGGGVLPIGGIALSLFLGIASERIERQRERDLEVSERARGEPGERRHAA